MAKKGVLAQKAAELEAAVAGLFTGTPAAPVKKAKKKAKKAPKKAAKKKPAKKAKKRGRRR